MENWSLNRPTLILEHMSALIHINNLAERMEVCMNAYFLFRIIFVNSQVFQWLRAFSAVFSLCQAVIYCCKISHFVTIWLMSVSMLWGSRGSFINVTHLHLTKHVVYSKNKSIILTKWPFSTEILVCLCLGVERCLSQNHFYFFHQLFT